MTEQRHLRVDLSIIVISGVGVYRIRTGSGNGSHASELITRCQSSWGKGRLIRLGSRQTMKDGKVEKDVPIYEWMIEGDE